MARSACIVVSASSEWRAVKTFYQPAELESTPFKETFSLTLSGWDCHFLHQGVGKIAAAAGTQYAIDRWHPRLILNPGTCGGIQGRIQAGQVVMASETLVYDLYERMGDPLEPIAFYSTQSDFSFLRQPYPLEVVQTRLLSADQDLDPRQIPFLVDTYQAVAVDWESGAIAWTAARNNVPALILRGVTDLVSPQGGESYDLLELFHQRTDQVMPPILASLPAWLEAARL